ADALQALTLRGVEALELVYQAFGMDPALGVLAEPELPGTVTEDHGIGEQLLLGDAAPQRPLGGDAQGIDGRAGRRRDAETGGMGDPGCLVVEADRAGAA